MAYKISANVEKTYGVSKNKVWKKGILGNYTFGTDQTSSDQIDDLTIQMNNEAKCMPDAFPVIVYQNGEFYGIYAWSLKKHRDNYHMK